MEISNDAYDNPGYGTFVKDLVCSDDVENAENNVTEDTEKLIEEIWLFYHISLPKLLHVLYLAN